MNSLDWVELAPCPAPGIRVSNIQVFGSPDYMRDSEYVEQSEVLLQFLSDPAS